MRFHHSTRRGRTRFSQAGAGHHAASCGTGGKFGGHPSALSNRWAQLSYCRQTNLHFNRRLPVELPAEMRQDQAAPLVLSDRTASQKQKANPQQQAHMSLQNLEQLDKLTLGGGGGGGETNNSSAGSSPSKSQHGRKHQHHTHTHQHQRQAVADSAQQEPATRAKGQAAASARAHPHASGRAKLDLESARAKLIAQVEKHPFWSNKAAKRMRLLDLQERQVYIYELTSYCERRDLEWRYEPYRGGKLGASPTSVSMPATAFGPTSVSGGGGGGGGHRPTALSSVSELASQANRAPSASQPASPPARTPPGGGAASARLSARSPDRFDFAEPLGQPQTQAALARPRPIRRACSSAASSPAKGAATAAAAASGPAAFSASALTFSPPLSPASLLLLSSAPRPLPEPELVWAIEPPAHLRPSVFASYVHTSEVPGTSFLKKCHGCEGRGRLKCSSCYGVGYEVCLSCTGKGSLRAAHAAAACAPGALGSGRALSRRHGAGAHDSSAFSSSRDHGGGGGGGPGSGSMWDNANCSSSAGRLGGARHDEPGGITAAGSSSAGSASEVCANCSGMGQKRCWICAGRSYITCTACAGTGTLRCHLNLNITYLNHRDELCLNNSDGIIPRERLKLSSGLLLADETADRLAPLAARGGLAASVSYYRDVPPTDGASVASNEHEPSEPTGQPQPHTQQNPRQQQQQSPPAAHLLEQLAKPMELSQLNAMSARLLERHAESYLRTERLIKQRHRVTQIDCFKINWEFRKKRGHFVVYGDERKVYIAKYPFKSICNIT